MLMWKIVMHWEERKRFGRKPVPREGDASFSENQCKYFCGALKGIKYMYNIVLTLSLQMRIAMLFTL